MYIILGGFQIAMANLEIHLSAEIYTNKSWILYCRPESTVERMMAMYIVSIFNSCKASQSVEYTIVFEIIGKRPNSP